MSITPNDALENAIKAAEASMNALKLATDPQEKARLSSHVQRLLKQAEQIKTHGAKPADQPGEGSTTNAINAMYALGPRYKNIGVVREPTPSRVIPKSEQIILLKASFLHGFKFPPWTKPPDASEFEYDEAAGLFTDEELPLSDLQQENLDGWKRPAEAFPPPSWFPDDHESHGPISIPTRKIDLVQDAATDCSVVASLCVCIARVEHGHHKISRTMMYPFDEENDIVALSKNGKYVARFNFNGCYRKVVVDDRLPTTTNGRVLHVVDRQNPGMLWPAMIEKAYLKVRGGYDFPGSNSATDLWMLTGWIPEQVFVQSEELEPKRLWHRMVTGFDLGHVLITMGTGKMSRQTERELGLAGEHDYAVLEVREVDGQRLLLIKNPWCEGAGWRGVSKRPDDLKASVEHAVATIEGDNEPVQNSRDLLNADDQLSPGTFWMDMDNVMQYFESIYLNWSPELFNFRADLHFAWDLSTQELVTSHARSPYSSLRRNPQFSVSAGEGGTIWVLLCRHLQNAVPADATPEEIEADRSGVELKGHISLVAFSNQGRRVFLPDRPVEKGWFVDSPQTLLKLYDCKPGEEFTLVPVEQELPAVNVTFTLVTFANTPIRLSEAAPSYLHNQQLAGVWNNLTAGGNAHSAHYISNPQYSIVLSRTSDVSLLLEAHSEEFSVHVKLLRGKGKRMHRITSKDIVFDSKDYRRGCCAAEFPGLEAGAYTIICSTFEPQQRCSFTLSVGSSSPVSVSLLPREDAGRLRVELPQAVLAPKSTKVAIQLVAYRLVQFFAVVRYSSRPNIGTDGQRSSPSPLRISIEAGRDLQHRILSVSNEGEYSTDANQIRTEDVYMSPEMQQTAEFWLIIDRMHVSGGSSEEACTVELFIDQPGAVGWREWIDVDV